MTPRIEIQYCSQCRISAIGLYVCLAFLLVMNQATAGRVFTNVSDDIGIQPCHPPVGMAGRLIAADYDNDGDIDMFVPNGPGSPEQLYQNQGYDEFLEISSQVGLDSTD